MDDTTADSAPMEPLFKSNKRKRTIFRRREEEDNVTTDTSAQGLPLVQEDLSAQVPSITSAIPQTDVEDTLPVAEILRRRRTTQPRRGGIEFSNSTSSNQVENKDSEESKALAIAERANAVELAGQRFAPQTGLVAETNSVHMTAFIESELARIRAGPSSSLHAISTNSIEENHADGTNPGITLPQRQPAALGQIQEIDLGPAAAARNAARTEEMARRLAAGERLVEEEQRKERVRLGRDGKPRPPRRRNRRASEDVERDRLVEAVLSENKLDLYTPPSPPRTITNGTDDLAGDEEVAERFRRDFLNAVESRNNVRRPVSTTATKPGDDKMKGPKLGGSRSARAAMHAAQKAGKK